MQFILNKKNHTQLVVRETCIFASSWLYLYLQKKKKKKKHEFSTLIDVYLTSTYLLWKNVENLPNTRIIWTKPHKFSLVFFYFSRSLTVE